LSLLGLIHPEGPDRDALATFLGRSGYQIVDPLEKDLDLSELSAIVAHESEMESFAATQVRNAPIFVLGNEVVGVSPT
jgi:hypothetical protein